MMLQWYLLSVHRFLHQWPERHVPRHITFNQSDSVSVCHVLCWTTYLNKYQPGSMLSKKTYIFIVNCLHPSMDWSVPAMGESIHCQPAACLWVPSHWFFLMVGVSETMGQNSFERMLANWISSPFVGCRCKWMLIDNSAVEAKMTNPQHHGSITLTET